MAEFNQSQRQNQSQTQKLSMRQIFGLNFLHMTSQQLTDNLKKLEKEYPALDVDYDSITPDEYSSFSSYESYESSQRNAEAIDNTEDKRESLQEHLRLQLLGNDLTTEQYELCEKLIYNLDNNGFYGSMIDPKKFLNKDQTEVTLNYCLSIIQHLDPIGCCTKNVEESLYIQALINNDASPLTLYILNGKFTLLKSSRVDGIASPLVIMKRLKKLKTEWESKEFTPHPFELSDNDITIESIEETLSYIRSNKITMYPASDYSHSDNIDTNVIDVVARVEKVDSHIDSDDFSTGKVRIDDNSYFQVTYRDNSIPDVKIYQDFYTFKDQLDDNGLKSLKAAEDIIEALKYREGTIIIQVCSIVKKQLAYFVTGEELKIVPLIRKDIAEILDIHESTVSRLTSKKNPKYIQLRDGVKPLSFFFSSGVTFNGKKGSKKVSSQAIKSRLKQIIEYSDKPLSDNEITKILNEKGLEIARRTVAKYRKELKIENSYERNIEDK